MRMAEHVTVTKPKRDQNGAPSSSGVRPQGLKEYILEKKIIGYNFAIVDGAESKFGTHKEIIVLKL